MRDKTVLLGSVTWSVAAVLLTGAGSPYLKCYIKSTLVSPLGSAGIAVTIVHLRELPVRLHQSYDNTSETWSTSSLHKRWLERSPMHKRRIQFQQLRVFELSYASRYGGQCAWRLLCGIGGVMKQSLHTHACSVWAYPFSVKLWEGLFTQVFQTWTHMYSKCKPVYTPLLYFAQFIHLRHWDTAQLVDNTLINGLHFDWMNLESCERAKLIRTLNLQVSRGNASSGLWI